MSLAVRAAQCVGGAGRYRCNDLARSARGSCPCKRRRVHTSEGGREGDVDRLRTGPFGRLRAGWPRKRAGFTLIELLVVIAIIALLVSVLIPALDKARILGRRVACQARLKTVGHAAMLYQEVHDEYVPIQVDNITFPAANPWMSWRALLLPYVSGYEAFNCPAARGSGEILESDEQVRARGLDTRPGIVANVGSLGIVAQWSLPGFKTPSCFDAEKQGHPTISLVFSTRSGVAWADPAHSVYVADSAWCEGPITYPTRSRGNVGSSYIFSPSEYDQYSSDKDVARRFTDRHLGTNCLFLGGHVLSYETRELDNMEAGDPNCVWDVH